MSSRFSPHGGGIAPRFNASSIAVRNAAVGTGFRRYATAPARHAYSSASPSSCAVMKMTGSLVPLATSERCSSKPVMSPRCTSITRHPEPGERPESSTSRPEAKVSALKPANSTRRRSARHTETSSSTIDTSVSSVERGCIACGRIIGPWSQVDVAAIRAQRRERLGHPNEVRHRTRAHLLHDPATMHLDGVLGDPQLAADLFVQTTDNDEIEDLALARGQRAEPSSEVGHTSPVAMFSSVFLDRPTHGIEQVTRPIRLREEIYRTRAHRADAHRDIAVRGDEHDGHTPIALREQVLQIEAGEAWHLDVENEAGGALPLRGIEKLVARGEAH